MNQVVGMDSAADGVAACASRGIQSYCMDPSSEPLPAESFDIVICLGTMEHMMSPYDALMEIRRVKAAVGTAILARAGVPADSRTNQEPARAQISMTCKLMRTRGGPGEVEQ